MDRSALRDMMYSWYHFFYILNVYTHTSIYIHILERHAYIRVDGARFLYTCRKFHLSLATSPHPRCATRAGSSATRPPKPTRALEAAIVPTKAKPVGTGNGRLFFRSLWRYHISYTYQISYIISLYMTSYHHITSFRFGKMRFYTLGWNGSTLFS